MPKRSSTEKDDDDDPILAAHRVLQHVIAQGEVPHPDILQARIRELERLCREAAEFAELGGLPPRVVGALRTVSRGLPVPSVSLLPITPDDNFPRESPAVALGRAGGLKGGHARAKALTKKRRREIAVTAANKRWKSKN